MSARKQEQPTKILRAFINHDPQATYTFDSIPDSPDSDLCRGNTDDCVNLQMNSKELFKAMQDFGFFCALPVDPQRTQMQCRPLTK